MNGESLLLSTAYFGNTNYWAELLSSEYVSIDLGEFFLKQTYRNRMEILGSNGIISLSIPLQKGKNSLATKEVKISYETDWQLLHLKTIKSAYGKAPFFEYFVDDLEFLFKKRPIYLFEWNQYCLDFVLNQLNIKNKSIHYSTEYISETVSIIDLRNSISPKNLNHILDYQHPEYYQVFSSKFGFKPALCILDLLFSEGRASIEILKSMNRK